MGVCTMLMTVAPHVVGYQYQVIIIVVCWVVVPTAGSDYQVSTLQYLLS